MLVKDYTYKDITAVNDDSSLFRVLTTMQRNRVSAIPIVTKTGMYVGCICEQDILNASAPNYMRMLRNTSFMVDLNKMMHHLQKILHEPAIQYIDKNYPTINCDESVAYAAELMYRSKKTVLPVLDKHQIYGLITRIDILSITLKSADK